MNAELILKNIDTIQRALDAIRQEFDEEQIDPYERRAKVLKRIYVRKWVNKDTLVKLVQAGGARPQWVGMQVKAGYLVKMATPDGPMYSVTEKAVREYQLDKPSIEEGDSENK